MTLEKPAPFRCTAAVVDGWAPDRWDRTVAGLADPHPFVHRSWQQAWWRHRGSGRLSVIASAHAVVAVGVDAGGTARLLGDPETTDHPSAPVAPRAATRVAAALLEHLGALGVRTLELRNAHPRDALSPALLGAAEDAGLRAQSSDDEPVARLALPASAEAWRTRLDRHVRHELERKRRRLAREHPTVWLRPATAETLSADLERFTTLMGDAAGAKGRFLEPSIVALWSDAAASALGEGRLALDTLESPAGPLAMSFGFRSAHTFWLYNMAYDRHHASVSPGLMLVDRLIERAIADGLSTVDFLRGTERYKLEFGAAPSHLQRVRIELAR